MAQRIASSIERAAGGNSGGTGGKGRRHDFRCRGCGYGIVASRPPLDGCPMCHATNWALTGKETLQHADPALARRRATARPGR
jgi:hypothetical protein